jgi:hypothetical protein
LRRQAANLFIFGRNIMSKKVLISRFSPIQPDLIWRVSNPVEFQKSQDLLTADRENCRDLLWQGGESDDRGF